MSEDLVWILAEAAGWLWDRFGAGRRASSRPSGGFDRNRAPEHHRRPGPPERPSPGEPTAARLEGTPAGGLRQAASAPTRRPQPVALPPAPAESPARPPDLAGRLARPEEVATALILAEVLGPPRGRQPYRPGRWLRGGPTGWVP